MTEQQGQRGRTGNRACCWSCSQWRGLTVSHMCTAHRPKVSKAWAGKLEQSSGAMDFLFSAACTAAIAADRPRSPLSWLTQHSREAAAALPLSKWSSCRLAAGVPAGSLVMGVHSARRGLSCYIIIIHKMRARARGHGARQPDCATLAHLLSPMATYSSILPGKVQGRGAWLAAVHGVSKESVQPERLSDQHTCKAE